MYLKIGDNEFKVEWLYNSDPNSPRADQNLPEITTCRISLVEGKNETVVAEGIAQTSVNDQPVKNVGRKLSLTRALANAYPHRETEFASNEAVIRELHRFNQQNKKFRKLFWDKYAESRHGRFD